LRDEIQSRLAILKREFETGQARLREVEKQESSLRETLLRISGAIQVLDELLTQDKEAPPKEVGEMERVPRKAVNPASQ